VGNAVDTAPPFGDLLRPRLRSHVGGLGTAGGGRPAVGELGARLVRWRVGWRWYLVVVLGPAAFSVAVALLYALMGGSFAAATPPALRSETPLVILPLFLVVLFLTDGVGEELAWRGFALPRLLTHHNALVTSLILGVLWAL
jgi:uncharacterized protein